MQYSLGLYCFQFSSVKKKSCLCLVNSLVEGTRGQRERERERERETDEGEREREMRTGRQGLFRLSCFKALHYMLIDSYVFFFYY